MTSTNHDLSSNTTLCRFCNAKYTQKQNQFLTDQDFPDVSACILSWGSTGNLPIAAVDTSISRPFQRSKMTRPVSNTHREDGPLYLPGRKDQRILKPRAGKEFAYFRVIWWWASFLLFSPNRWRKRGFSPLSYRQHIQNSTLLQRNGRRPLCSVVCGVYHVSRTRARVGALGFQRSSSFFPGHFSRGLELPPDGTRTSETTYFQCSVNASTRTGQMPTLSSQPPDISARMHDFFDFPSMTLHLVS
jgi:hypothetical protein